MEFSLRVYFLDIKLRSRMGQYQSDIKWDSESK